MNKIEICETFTSLQGESTRAGELCFFIRLAGCNLNCNYCDTPAAHEKGELRTIESLVTEAVAAETPIIQITGGEPLIHENFGLLAESLSNNSMSAVMVETNGSIDISVVPDRVITILDIKCPGSGSGDSFLQKNIELLGAEDEVKFVLSDRADYDWAGDFIKAHQLKEKCGAILFSPAVGRLEPDQLAKWIIADRLPVRIQLQLHKIIGVR